MHRPLPGLAILLVACGDPDDGRASAEDGVDPLPTSADGPTTNDTGSAGSTSSASASASASGEATTADPPPVSTQQDDP